MYIHLYELPHPPFHNEDNNIRTKRSWGGYYCVLYDVITTQLTMKETKPSKTDTFVYEQALKRRMNERNFWWYDPLELLNEWRCWRELKVTCYIQVMCVYDF